MVTVTCFSMPCPVCGEDVDDIEGIYTECHGTERAGAGRDAGDGGGGVMDSTGKTDKLPDGLIDRAVEAIEWTCNCDRADLDLHLAVRRCAPLLIAYGREQALRDVARNRSTVAEAAVAAERAKWEARIEAARVHAAQIQRDLKTRIRASNVTIAALAKTEAALEARVLELREVIEGLLQIATAYLDTDEPPSMAAVSTGRDALTLWRRIEDPLNTPDSQLTEEADCA